MHSGWHICLLHPAAKDFEELSKTKLTMPVLPLEARKQAGQVLGEQMRVVATDATMLV